MGKVFLCLTDMSLKQSLPEGSFSKIKRHALKRTPFLFDRFCPGFFLRFFHCPFEKAFFLLWGCNRLSVEPFDFGDVNAANRRFYLFFDMDHIEDFLVAYEGHDLRAYFGFNDWKFGTAQ